jgi:hypothetical protein
MLHSFINMCVGGRSSICKGQDISSSSSLEGDWDTWRHWLRSRLMIPLATGGRPYTIIIGQKSGSCSTHTGTALDVQSGGVSQPPQDWCFLLDIFVALWGQCFEHSREFSSTIWPWSPGCRYSLLWPLSHNKNYLDIVKCHRGRQSCPWLTTIGVLHVRSGHQSVHGYKVQMSIFKRLLFCLGTMDKNIERCKSLQSFSS